MLATVASSALIAFTPVVIHDSAERYPLAAAGRDAPIAHTAGRAPAAYGREVPARAGGRWLQYWLYYPYQDQDRGIVRTGRHTGDWELVQYRVDADDRLQEAVYAQHSGAERCGASNVEFSGHPIVYAAHGSHASYFHAGTRDRTWPDPNDEADGKGRLTRPELVEISRTSPAWMTYPDPWGPSRAHFFLPGEQDSPKGPYFQPDRWDADAFAASAHPCMPTCTKVNVCDRKETRMRFALVFGIALIGIVASAARRMKRDTPKDDPEP